MSSTKPAATTHTATPHAITAAPQGTPSQPAPAKQAITAVQRQWAYRQRSKRAVIQAIGYETQASRVTLLALLGSALALLGDETAGAMHCSARNSARRVINALVTRYDINLEAQDRT